MFNIIKKIFMEEKTEAVDKMEETVAAESKVSPLTEAFGSGELEVLRGKINEIIAALK